MADQVDEHAIGFRERVASDSSEVFLFKLPRGQKTTRDGTSNEAVQGLAQSGSALVALRANPQVVSLKVTDFEVLVGNVGQAKPTPGFQVFRAFVNYWSLRCAVRRHGLPVGANPTRQLSLQPVVIGAVAQGAAAEAFGVEGHIGDSASVQAVMRMNVEQASKANDAEADPAARRGRL